LKKNYPTLTRGLAIKSGKGVNGIYNQDMSENAILIELGGQYNSIVEVNNTITILTKALYAYIKGEL
jgi:stage II sporulation protein P